MVDLVSHMTLEQDLSDLETMWSFPPSFPCVTMQEHVETMSGGCKSVTRKFLMTVSPEMLTFSLKPVKFNPGTAGNSTELPALN